MMLLIATIILRPLTALIAPGRDTFDEARASHKCFSTRLSPTCHCSISDFNDDSKDFHQFQWLSIKSQTLFVAGNNLVPTAFLHHYVLQIVIWRDTVSKNEFENRLEKVLLY